MTSLSAPRLPVTFCCDERALSSQRFIDLAYSANLYQTTEQALLYERVRRVGSYHDSVISPLYRSRSYLADVLRRRLPRRQRVAFYDCGPDPAEAAKLLRQLDETLNLERYIAVDVNGDLLTATQEALSEKRGLRVDKRLSAFESFSLANERLAKGTAVVLFFGATGINYSPRTLRALLQRMTKPRTIVSLQTIIGNAADSYEAYGDAATQRFAFEPLRLLGGTKEQFSFKVGLSRNRLDMLYVANERVALGRERLEVKRGDVVRTAFSRRHSLASFAAEFAVMGHSGTTIVGEGGAALAAGVVGNE
jgi:hypothetical protein